MPGIDERLQDLQDRDAVVGAIVAGLLQAEMRVEAAEVAFEPAQSELAAEKAKLDAFLSKIDELEKAGFDVRGALEQLNVAAPGAIRDR